MRIKKNKLRYFLFAMYAFFLASFLIIIISTRSHASNWPLYDNAFSCGANPGEMISFGGTSVLAEEGRYFIDDAGAVCLGDACVVSAPASCLNYYEGALYFARNDTNGFRVRRYDIAAGLETEVFQKNTGVIRELYLVNGEEFWYLSDNQICHFSNGTEEVVHRGDSIFGFAVTKSGIIYAEGSIFDYTIYANENRITEHASSFTVDPDMGEGYILYEKDGRNYQVALDAALIGNREAEPFHGYGTVDTEELLRDLTHPDTELRSQETENPTRKTAMRGYRKNISTGVQNIVRRAYQMTNIQWTPVANVVGWGSGLTYYAGRTYTGLPYGQPVYASYVPWSTSLTQFISYVNDPGSKMYTSYSSYNQRAPYYSIDCSAFVSWAWNLGSRQTTSSMHNYATTVSSTSYANMQVGDCFCKAGSHVVLVTDIIYNGDGTISEVEISESTVNAATNYCCQKTWYGAGHNYSLSYMKSKYLDDGYILYRSNTRDNVTYTHISAVTLPDDVHSDVLTSSIISDCTTVGRAVYTCSVCGRVRTETTAAPGHSFGPWAVTVAANCVAVGSELRTCTRCGQTETRTIPADGHKYNIQTIMPTCTDNGYNLHICSICGNQFADNIIPANGHSFILGICSVCGAVDESTIKGDTNLDGVVSSADAVLLARYLIGKAQLSKAQVFAADINCDDKVSSADAVFLAKVLIQIPKK